MISLFRDTLQSKILDRYRENYPLIYLSENERLFKTFLFAWYTTNIRF